MKNSIAEILRGFLIILLFSLGLSGCSKDQGGKNGSKIAIKVRATLSEGETQPLTYANEGQASAVKVYTTEKDGLIIDTEMKEISSGPKTYANTSQNLLQGTKFRVAAYDSNDNFVSYTDYVITDGNGTCAPANGNEMYLTDGNTYTFVCYSYGNGSLPTPDTSSKRTIAVLNNVSNTNDLMYFTTTLRISSSTTNYLNVVFLHNYVQIQVQLNSTVGSITACTASFSPIQSYANMNLWNGLISTYGPDVSGGQRVDFTDSLGRAVVTSKQAIYCINPSNAIALNLSSLTIGGTTKSFTLSDFSFGSGKTYLVSINISSGINLGGITWAPGNLYATKNTDGSYSYGFYGNQYTQSNDITNGNDFFQWGTLYPGSHYGPGVEESRTYSSANDPCTKVGSGTWKTPSAAAINVLKTYNQSFAVTNYPGTNVTGMFIGTSNKPSNPNQYLFLPYVGIDGKSSTTGGYYWTTKQDSPTANGSAADFIYNNATQYYFLEIQSQYKNSPMPIRCVKTSTDSGSN